MINKSGKSFNETYWASRWENGQTGWDIGGPAPAIIQYFKNFEPKTIAILIPGCGNAYEAQALWEMGFRNITIIDIVAEKAIELQEKFKNTGIKVIHSDFFLHQGQYDYIIEHTFFCSLHVPMRTAYAQKMASLLKDGGKLVGLLFNREFEGTEPPFGGNIEEYTDLFHPYFQEVMIAAAENSILPRKGSEVFIKLQK